VPPVVDGAPSPALRLLLKRNRRAAAQPLPRRRVSGFDRLARRRRRDRRGRYPSAHYCKKNRRAAAGAIGWRAARGFANR